MCDIHTKVLRKPMSLRRMLDRLIAVQDHLNRESCTFFACCGPHRVRHMITCSNCYAKRDIALAIKHLRLRLGLRDGIAS